MSQKVSNYSFSCLYSKPLKRVGIVNFQFRLLTSSLHFLIHSASVNAAIGASVAVSVSHKDRKRGTINLLRPSSRFWRINTDHLGLCRKIQ